MFDVTCTYVHGKTFTRTHLYLHTYTSIHTYMYTYIHTYKTYIHTYKQTKTYIHTHIMHTKQSNIHTYIHTYIHTHRQADVSRRRTILANMGPQRIVTVRNRQAGRLSWLYYTSKRKCVIPETLHDTNLMRVCIHIYVCVCMYVCVYVCVYVMDFKALCHLDLTFFFDELGVDIC